MAPRMQKQEDAGVYMHKLVERILSILHEGEIEYAELQGVGIEFVCGLCLLFSRLHGELLGISFLVVCALHLIGLRQMSYRIRRAASMVSFVVWVFAAGRIADNVNEWWVVLSPMCATFAISFIWTFFRLGRHEDMAELRSRHVRS